MIRVWLSVNLKRHGVDCRGPSGASARGHARTGLECGGRSAPVLISDLDHRAVADDHRDVAVPDREVAGHWPGDHTGAGSPTRCAPLVPGVGALPRGWCRHRVRVRQRFVAEPVEDLATRDSPPPRRFPVSAPVAPASSAAMCGQHWSQTVAIVLSGNSGR